MFYISKWRDGLQLSIPLLTPMDHSLHLPFCNVCTYIPVDFIYSHTCICNDVCAQGHITLPERGPRHKSVTRIYTWRWSCAPSTIEVHLVVLANIFWSLRGSRGRCSPNMSSCHAGLHVVPDDLTRMTFASRKRLRKKTNRSNSCHRLYDRCSLYIFLH